MHLPRPDPPPPPLSLRSSRINLEFLSFPSTRRLLYPPAPTSLVCRSPPEYGRPLAVSGHIHFSLFFSLHLCGATPVFFFDFFPFFPQILYFLVAQPISSRFNFRWSQAPTPVSSCDDLRPLMVM